jgi:hypothetical protein
MLPLLLPSDAGLKKIAIVVVSDLRTGYMKGAAIIFAAVVTRLHHDTAPVC